MLPYATPGMDNSLRLSKGHLETRRGSHYAVQKVSHTWKLVGPPGLPWLDRLYSQPARAPQAFNHSEVVLSWGAEFPDKLKIRKELRAWPLRFKLRADYCRASRAFEYGCSCKVPAWGGL